MKTLLVLALTFVLNASVVQANPAGGTAVSEAVETVRVLQSAVKAGSLKSRGILKPLGVNASSAKTAIDILGENYNLSSLDWDALAAEAAKPENKMSSKTVVEKFLAKAKGQEVDGAFKTFFTSGSKTTEASSNVNTATASKTGSADEIGLVKSYLAMAQVSDDVAKEMKTLIAKAEKGDLASEERLARGAKVLQAADRTSAQLCGDLDSKTCLKDRLDMGLTWTISVLSTGGEPAMGFAINTLYGFENEPGANVYPASAYVPALTGVVNAVRANQPVSQGLLSCLWNGKADVGSRAGDFVTAP